MDGGKYLFLGGRCDGQWKSADADRVQIPFLNSEGGVGFHQYRPLRLAGEVSEQVIYVEDSLTPDDIVRLLVENYRPQKERTNSISQFVREILAEGE